MPLSGVGNASGAVRAPVRLTSRVQGAATGLWLSPGCVGCRVPGRRIEGGRGIDCHSRGTTPHVSPALWLAGRPAYQLQRPVAQTGHPPHRPGTGSIMPAFDVHTLTPMTSFYLIFLSS